MMATVHGNARLARHVADIDDDGHHTGGGGGFDLGWYNVEDYGAVHDGTTDDTAAIQDTIDACFAGGGGTVWFPSGVYLIDGALRDTSTYNSQLELPQSSSAVIGIRFLGELSTLQSTWAGTISGTPSVISAGTHDSHTLNLLFVKFERIRILLPADPKLTAIDVTKAVTVRWNDLLIYAAQPVSALPTHSNAVGLDCPWGFNDQNTGGEDLYIIGLYTGIRPSEQTQATAIYVAYCTRAAEFRGSHGAPDYLAHMAAIQRFNVWFCQRGLVFTGDRRSVNINVLDVEHNDPSFTTVYDIDDASNYGRGFIGVHISDYTTGDTADDLLINGATGLSIHEDHAKRWRFANVVDIPIGTNPSTNPANGRRLYTDSATGHLSARTSAGATIDYEAGTGVSALDDLSDVTITTPTLADHLRYDGSVWRNSPLIWRSMTAFDPTTGNWLPLVDGSGNQIIAEA